MPFWLRVVAVVECSRLCLMVFAFPAFLVLLWPVKEERRLQAMAAFFAGAFFRALAVCKGSIHLRDGGVLCRRVSSAPAGAMRARHRSAAAALSALFAQAATAGREGDWGDGRRKEKAPGAFTSARRAL